MLILPVALQGAMLCHAVGLSLLTLPQQSSTQSRLRNPQMRSSRVIIFLVAYNAELTLVDVLNRIPCAELGSDTQILVIDDSSRDNTFEIGLGYRLTTDGIPLTVLRTPVNQ